MRPETEHVDPIDDALRATPMWDPPAGFAWRVTVAASAATVHDDARDWVSWLRALEQGALAGLGVYMLAVLWRIIGPDLLMNGIGVAWMTVALSLAWAAYVSRSLFSRI